jgi:preprotein translocase subunit YajC
MTPSPALAHFVLAASSSSKSSSTNPLVTLLPLLAIGVLGYFFFIKPQQRKAQAARAAQNSAIEVGDEVQTVGGVIGTVLEIHGDRYTLLTGALGDDGNLDGPQPTRIVFVRQAIAKKIDRIDDIRIEDAGPVDDVRPRDAEGDIDDVGGDISGASANGDGTAEGDGAAKSGGEKAKRREQGGEAEQA